MFGHNKTPLGVGQYRAADLPDAGMYLDQVMVMAFSHQDYQNPLLRGWLQYAEKMNPPKALISKWSKSVWGMLVNPFSQRVVLVVGNPESPATITDSRSLEIRQLGGRDQIFDASDLAKIEAYLQAYFTNYQRTSSSIGSSGVIITRIVIDGANYGDPSDYSVSTASTDNWFTLTFSTK